MAPQSRDAAAPLLKVIVGIRRSQTAPVKKARAAEVIASAAPCGATTYRICEVSRHNSMQVLMGYVREAEAVRDHAGGGFL